MATRFLHCDKCQQEYYQSDSKAFNIVCERCDTIIRSSNGLDLWYDHSNYSTYWKPARKSTRSLENKEASISPEVIALWVVATLFVAALCIGLYLAPDKEQHTTIALKPPPMVINDTANLHTTTETVTAAPSARYEQIQAETKSQVIIYSGKCTFSKKMLNGTQMTLQSIRTAFAKVVINRASKRLYFYYDGKLVFHYSGYNDYTDDQQGGEGFTFDSDADAHRYAAERVFVLNTEMMMGQLGYQYQITDYKED